MCATMRKTTPFQTGRSVVKAVKSTDIGAIADCGISQITTNIHQEKSVYKTPCFEAPASRARVANSKNCALALRLRC